MDKNLHIITFDIPYPPDYGGVTDLFYKIRSLNSAGVKIYLHCYYTVKKHADQLNDLCEEVHYYKRSFNPLHIFDPRPFIVASRSDRKLLNNLINNNHSILFDGLHTTSLLGNKLLKNRKKIVRTHNIEHDYYSHLANNEKNLFRKIFFRIEAKKLKNYENILKYADIIAAISPRDQTYFSTISKTVWIPPFHQWQTLPTIEEQGDYILFHGNLSVNENIRAVRYLIKYVFSRISLPVIIAGKNPEHKVCAEAKSIKNIRVIANPSGEEMNWLISKAMINILITFQPTGFKVKLINAIFGGGHTIVNKIMIENSRMEKLCNIADTPEEIISTINRLQSINFNDCKEIISERKKALNSMFSNKNNAAKIVNLLDDGLNY